MSNFLKYRFLVMSNLSNPRNVKVFTFIYISPSEKVNGYKKETSFIVFYGLSINQPYLPLSYGTTKTIIVIYEALSFA